MIDADRTLSCLGVEISTLTHGSNKKVFAVCEECGKYRVLSFQSYHELCRFCTSKGERSSRYIKPAPKEDLERLYLVEKQIPDKIGVLYNVSGVTIKKWLKKYNIPIRSYKEAHTLVDMSGENNPMYGRTGELAPAFGRHGTKHYMFGKQHSDKTKRKISRPGATNPAWRGGITPWRNQMYKSQVYQSWRKAVFERDNYTCQMCGDDTGHNLQAHHIRPVRHHKNDLLLFDMNNGITLCKECHKPTIRKESDFEAFFYALVSAKAIL